MPSRPSAMRLLLNHATVSARPRKRRLESYKQPQVESEKRRRLRAPNRQPDSEAIDGRTRLIAALTARGKWLAHHDRFLLLNGHSLGGIRMAVLAEKQPTIETLIVSQSALVRFIQPRGSGIIQTRPPWCSGLSCTDMQVSFKMDRHALILTGNAYTVPTRNPENKKPNPKIGLSA